MIKPITSLVVLAITIGAFAQSQTVKIKSRGEDFRTVIDTIFEQTGKQYVLETNYHQSLYMNLEGISFQKAIEIVSNVTDMEFEERQGIWYIHKKPAAAAHTFSNPSTTKKKTSDPVATKSTTGTKPTEPKTKAPAKSKDTKKPTPAKEHAAAQKFTTAMTPIEAAKPKVNLTGKLTVQLKKMDIRTVFSEMGQQANVEIEVDESVPSYKLDASFYNTTLKFALDKICKVAKLKYSMTPNNTVRVSKI
jgi:type II secretory pathway component GspD/PulD (secretin)